MEVDARANIRRSVTNMNPTRVNFDKHFKLMQQFELGPGNLKEISASSRAELNEPAPVSIDKAQDTLFLRAVRMGRPETVRNLAKMGSAVDMTDSNGQNAIYIASVGGHEEVLRFLLGCMPQHLEVSYESARHCQNM